MGVDGATYTLTLADGDASSEYSWWCDTGKGWGALPCIIKGMENLATEFLGRELRYL